MAIDTEAQRLMRERFGSEKPIPAATSHRALRIQEACRLYIHHFWELKECATFAGCSESNLCKVKQSDDWDGFACLISQEMKPSVWVASDIEIPDINLIQREKKRRVDDIPVLQAEEMKIMQNLDGMPAFSKGYGDMLNSLIKVRKLIDDATGAAYFHSEQSAGRRAMIQKHINAKDNPAEPKPTHGLVVDVS